MGGKAGKGGDNDDGTNAIQASFRERSRAENVLASADAIYIRVRTSEVCWVGQLEVVAGRVANGWIDVDIREGATD